jgi:tripartite-type tricarboxylate transporter receptor subunit TctC
MAMICKERRKRALTALVGMTAMPRWIIWAIVSALLVAPALVRAQDWPALQPVKVVVPFTAGSATDIIARIVFEQVGKQVGQTFVVENRGGAGTTIGMAMVAKANPDGYTILVNSSSQVTVPSTYAKLPFDTAEDFVGVTSLANLPLVVAAPTKYKTLRDLIAAAKAKPGSINYGSAGAGSAGQMFMERLRLAAGYEGTHVPFRGTPEAISELIADRLDIYPAPVPSAISLAREGKISALAVSSPKRLASMPEVPTTTEAGVVNADYNFWAGVFVPAKTPRAIIERMHREIVAALALDELKDKIAKLGGEPNPMSPAEFGAFVRREIALNAEIVKASGFKPQ